MRTYWCIRGRGTIRTCDIPPPPSSVLQPWSSQGHIRTVLCPSPWMSSVSWNNSHDIIQEPNTSLTKSKVIYCMGFITNPGIANRNPKVYFHWFLRLYGRVKPRQKGKKRQSLPSPLCFPFFTHHVLKFLSTVLDQRPQFSWSLGRIFWWSVTCAFMWLKWLTTQLTTNICGFKLWGNF